MSFDQLALHPQLQKAIEACGYTSPTPIQAKSIPVVLAGKDLVASAQTGTGKTAAFVLPALHLLIQQKPIKKPRILILTPTRELAAQVTKSAATYGKFLQFKVVSLVGGMPYYHQIKDLARGADIIVATPGRLIDHVEEKRVDLSHIQLLVLDEADRMLDMGFVDDVTKIAKMTPPERQTLLFSATIDKQLSTVIRHILKNPVRIDLSHEKVSAPKIKQEAYRTKSMQHKMQLLKHFLMNKNIYKAIIFSATKVNADKLVTDLRHEGLAAAALHGDLRQNVRNRTIEQFRNNKVQFLVATDVAARGIHVDDVTHVINFDLPKFSEDYVHRIGRTGRAGKEGVAISFVSSSDVQHLQRIERFTGEKLKLINNIDLAERDEMSPDRLIKITDLNMTGERRGRHGDGDRPRKRFDGERKRFGSDRAPRADRSEEYQKRFGSADRDSAPRGERKHFGADRDEAPRGERKRFGGDRDSAAPRGERKRFGGDRDGAAPRSERSFGGDRDGAPRGERKRFGADRDGAAPRSERSFGGDRDGAPRGERKRFGADRDGAPRGERKRFGSDRDGAAPRSERSFGGDRDGAPRGERKRFGSDRDEAPRGERKRFGADRDGAAPRGERKRFGADRDGAAPRGERKRFGADRDSAAPRGERKRFGSDRDGAAPRGERSFGGKSDRPAFGKKKPFGGAKKPSRTVKGKPRGKDES